MICTPEILAAAKQSAVCSHVVAEIESLCGAELHPDTPDLEELGKAVAHFVQEHVDEAAVDSQYLVLLASQALSSLGRERAARRLYLMGSGMVRVSEWEVTGDRTMWILDLRQLTVRDGASIELIFFNGLRLILEAIADAWDSTRGEGILGLRHVCAAASVMLGSAAGKKEIAVLCEEIRTVCGRKLQQLKAERNWDESPDVMMLDFQ